MSLDCVSVWNNCLRIIQENIGETSFNTWFAPIVPVKLENSVLTIQVPSQFFYEWLEEHYVHVLRKAIDNQLGANGRLEYSVILDRGNAQHKPYTVNYATANKPNYSQGLHHKNGNVAVAVEEAPPFDSHISSNYLFDNYIEGDCNRLARSAGYAVAKKPGITSFNPLMVYGGVGLGKTHLVHAIGNEIKQNIPSKLVLYISTENFSNQFIDSVQNNRMNDFTQQFLQVDVLIIDDVQFLAGKEKTQEVFFNIFNQLHQSGKQIIMTSDCPPRELKGLQERLLSRFKWGLTADLQQPDFETRIAIIRKKMLADGIHIPENVVEYLAYTVDTNIRELEGVLISLIAHATLTRRELDLELAKQTLKNIVHDIESEVGIDYIQKTVADFYRVSLDELKDKTRKKEIVIARQVAMYFAKAYTNHSLKSIGYHFGGRDHSTVIHAVQSVEDMMDVDSKFRGAIEELQRKLKIKGK